MQADRIQIERIDKVAVFTLNNPPANALGPEVRDEFLFHLETASRDESVWTLILTGAGEKFFAAGADIHSLLELDRETGLKRVQASRRFYSGVANLEKPVIAAINGICLGGGLELALACDIRIAVEQARLGVPEVNLGLIPGAGGTQRLPRAIGPGWANYLLFTGEALPASKALEIGLIQMMVSREALLSTALDLAKKINRKGPLAVRAAKKAAAAAWDLPIEQGLDLENLAFAELCATEDKQEGISAFLEKRKPVFKNR
jgi:enoyl-CoA hydratase